MAKSQSSVRKKVHSPTTLRALKRENSNLRGTIDEIWDILNEVPDTASSDEMFSAIDAACHRLISDLPDDYYYDDQEVATSTQQEDVEQLKSSIVRYRERLA